MRTLKFGFGGGGLVEGGGSIPNIGGLSRFLQVRIWLSDDHLLPC